MTGSCYFRSLFVSALAFTTFGCAYHISSDNEDGRFIVSQTVNTPKDVPKELENYAPWFEQQLETRGFLVGNTNNPHAMQLQLLYSDTPQDLKITVHLLLNNAVVLRVISSNDSPQDHTDKQALVAHLIDNALKAFNNQLQDIAPRLMVDDRRQSATPNTSMPSAATGNEAIVSFGTAFATNSPITYVTARHVVDGAARIRLYCGPDKIADAELLAVDTSNDLAVLKSKQAAPAFLELAPADSAGPGDHVFTIGFPTPDLLGISPKYTDGAISSLSGLGDSRSLMQISVPIQPGNSGGPLVDAQGRVVGVIDSTAAVASFYHATGVMPQNVNFAVSSYYLYPLVKDIPHGATARFAKLTPVKRVTASLCLVVVNEKN